MTKENNKKTEPCINFTKTTPYMVSNLENFYDSQGNHLNTKPVMALCRCGQSRNKPYCDGSHNTTGIDGEKLPGRLKDKVHSFKGKEITIHDNRAVCSHDRACVRELPQVFKTGRRPWINPNGASVEEITAVIAKCPSGALSYTLNNIKWNGPDREPAIKVAENGPLEVTGSIRLQDDMNSTPQSTEHYTLCRCGGSKNKPFCDGIHLTNGFSENGK